MKSKYWRRQYLNLLTSLTFLIFPLFCSTCKDKPVDKELICTKENTVLFPENWLPYLYFSDSAYWIYRDSVYGTIDSVYITSRDEFKTNELKDRKVDTKCYQHLIYEFRETQETYLTQVWLIPFRISDEPGIKEEYDCVFVIVDNNTDFPIYRFGFVDSNITTTTEEGGIIEQLNIIKVNGSTFQNIIHLRYPGTTSDIYKHAYYAKNIGLVKYIRKDSSVWELLRYRIN